MSGDVKKTETSGTGGIAGESLSACFARLRAAERFEGYAFGGMGQKNKNYEAFARAREAGGDARAAVEDILRSGTPAGRLYAALLLREIDEEAGRRALVALQADASELEAAWDCAPDAFTVGQLAAEALQGRMLIDIRPPLRGTT
ncbi:MAG TPA: hypothetical protein VNA19_11635 [Pyrinomonadaceae bacterium]|jgi:hypothetical protein|nr:hypothetical protein [Pyrinomonadaceae bacterium]